MFETILIFVNTLAYLAVLYLIWGLPITLIVYGFYSIIFRKGTTSNE